MATRGNLDRLSSFPDDILSHILTFIPMKSAVQTSVLSTRWRYLFASMSSLDFGDIFSDVDMFLNPKHNRSFKSLKKFAYRLSRSPNQGSLECFRLSLVSMAYHDCLSHLVHFALRRGVKEIDLELFRVDLDEIVTPLFTCQSLVTLKLDPDYLIFTVPSTICLPNLKSFHLRHWTLTDDSISRLISSCRVLEDLVLVGLACEFDNDNADKIYIQSLSLKTLVLDCNHMGGSDYVMLINAPSLVHFQYTGYIAEDYTISSMTSLIKAEIRISRFGDGDRQQSVNHLLQGICNVRSLCLSIDYDVGTLFQTRIGPVLAFHNLVELEFHNGRNDWIGTRLVEFLRCVPNLKTLILYLAVVQRTFMFPPEEIPSCLSSHLKEITISNLREEQPMFELISYFLDNAMVLEKLRLGFETLPASLHKQLSLFNKLWSLPSSSSTCQVLIF